MWVMNHLKQHLRVWHCKRFAIWGFIKDKWGFIKDQFLIVEQLLHQENTSTEHFWRARIVKPIDGHCSLLVRGTNRKKQKPVKKVALQVSSGQHVGKGHIISSRKLPAKFPCFYLIYLLFLHFHLATSFCIVLSFFHPVIWCILLSYLPSLLHFKSSGLLTLMFFNWTGLPKLRGKTAHPKDELTLLLSFPVG